MPELQSLGHVDRDTVALLAGKRESPLRSAESGLLAETQHSSGLGDMAQEKSCLPPAFQPARYGVRAPQSHSKRLFSTTPGPRPVRSKPIPRFVLNPSATAKSPPAKS